MSTNSEIVAVMKEILQSHTESQKLTIHQYLQQCQSEVLTILNSKLEELRSPIYVPDQSAAASSSQRRNFRPEGNSTEIAETSQFLHSMRREAPKFDGADPDGWICQDEDYQFPLFSRPAMAAFSVAKAYEDYQGRCSNLTRGAKFQMDFESSTKNIAGISENLFPIADLKPDLQMEVPLVKPASLMGASTLSNSHGVGLEESCGPMQIGLNFVDGSIHDQPSYSPNHTSETKVSESSSTNIIMTESLYISPKTPPNPPISHTPTLLVQKLSQIEIHKEIEKGSCCICEKEESTEHKFMRQLMCLLSIDDCVEKEKDERVDGRAEIIDEFVGAEVFTFKSLKGLSNPRSLYLLCEVKGQNLHILIYSLSAYNFVSFVSLLVLPIRGLVMVLGVQWLQEISEIMHDHNEMKMKICWQEGLVTSSGSVLQRFIWVSFDQLHGLIHNFLVDTTFELSLFNDAEASSIHSLQDSPKVFICAVMKDWQNYFHLLSTLKGILLHKTLSTITVRDVFSSLIVHELLDAVGRVIFLLIKVIYSMMLSIVIREKYHGLVKWLKKWFDGRAPMDNENWEEHFNTKLYIPIEGPDVVLGVEWLLQSGRVLYDNSKMIKELEW